MVNLDWNNLPFGYIKTDFNVRCYFRNGQWSKPEISDSEHISIHIAATGLHYGQEAFEGMKAYRGRDGKVRLFRWDENAKRLLSSAHGVHMAPVPEELFREAVFTAVRLNEKFVPPYGSGASLYVRPVLYGSGAEVGVKPASEYTFIVFVTPVGPYFKGGVKPVNMLICRDVAGGLLREHRRACERRDTEDDHRNDDPSHAVLPPLGQPSLALLSGERRPLYRSS